MTKSQIKLAAKVYAAVLIDNALGTGADSECFTHEDDRANFDKELELIANRLVKQMPGGDMVLAYGNLDDIVNYAKFKA